MQAVSTSTEDTNKQKSEALSKWVIAAGIGLTFAIGTATTVYYMKTRQKRSMKALRYGDDYQSESNYKKKLVKYWNFGVRTFQAVSTVVIDFLKPKAKTVNTPLVNGAAADLHLDQLHEDEL